MCATLGTAVTVPSDVGFLVVDMQGAAGGTYSGSCVGGLGEGIGHES